MLFNTSVFLRQTKFIELVSYQIDKYSHLVTVVAITQSIILDLHLSLVIASQQFT